MLPLTKNNNISSSSLSREPDGELKYIKPVPSQILSLFSDEENKVPIHIDLDSGKENKERGSCGNGRLLIHLYYSAVTGNRKQVLTGSSESCEHKCR